MPKINARLLARAIDSLNCSSSLTVRGFGLQFKLAGLDSEQGADLEVSHSPVWNGFVIENQSYQLVLIHTDRKQGMPYPVVGAMRELIDRLEFNAIPINAMLRGVDSSITNIESVSSLPVDVEFVAPEVPPAPRPAWMDAIENTPKDSGWQEVSL